MRVQMTARIVRIRTSDKNAFVADASLRIDCEMQTGGRKRIPIERMRIYLSTYRPNHGSGLETDCWVEIEAVTAHVAYKAIDAFLFKIADNPVSVCILIIVLRVKWRKRSDQSLFLLRNRRYKKKKRKKRLIHQ